VGKNQNQGSQARPAAIAKAAEPVVACGHCRCFQPPAVRPGADATALASAGLDRGICLRFPTPVTKAAIEHCFEFIAKEAVNA
jgi:hypothetical protein